MSSALLIRRRGMMEQDDGIVLPSGYTKLKYVQGQTRHALFNTYYLPNNNTRVIIYAKKLSFKQYSPFFAAYYSEGYNTTRIIQGTTYDDIISNVNVRAGGGGSLHTTINTLEMHRYYIGRNYIYIDGAFAGSNTAVYGTESNYNIKINSSSGILDGQDDDPITVFGQIQFLFNTVVERHFVPCINPSNICGFYEIMTGTFYGSDYSQYPFQPY